MTDEIERRSMPWLNVVFDWEGVAAAAAAFLASLLLGWIWGPSVLDRLCGHDCGPGGGPLVAPVSAGFGGRRGGAL